MRDVNPLHPRMQSLEFKEFTDQDRVVPSQLLATAPKAGPYNVARTAPEFRGTFNFSSSTPRWLVGTPCDTFNKPIYQRNKASDGKSFRERDSSSRYQSNQCQETPLPLVSSTITDSLYDAATAGTSEASVMGAVTIEW